MNHASVTGLRSNGERGGTFFRLMVLLVFLLLLFVLYLVRRPILREMGNLWVVDEPPTTADALIVLSDDDYWGSRVERAAELFHENRAPVVVASGRLLRPYAGIAELMQHDLTERGIPAASIVVLKHQADDTLEEAQALRALVLQRGWKHVVVVTSNYHTRRARYIFRKVFPARVTVDVAAARDPAFDPVDWWEHRSGIKFFARELAGFVVAMWELRHMNPETGSNSSELRRPSQSTASRRGYELDTSSIRNLNPQDVFIL